MGFEQLQDSITGQLGPFPGHSPSNKLRSCFWTGVLNWLVWFFFSITLNSISCISTCVHCLLSFCWAPLRGRLYLLLVLIIPHPPTLSPFSEAQAVTTRSVSLVPQSLNSLSSLVGSPSTAVCLLIVQSTGQAAVPDTICPQEGVSLLVTPSSHIPGCCW